ncbi:elongation factor P [Altericroceibacterium endophyticum]|uniref:Elongation factor P n=1 Tax=Altericroceibacterium endophyticum TaxID=1808508 RepID=A0A6I4T0M0_9SPHN|nr:elongation factor P [Altericroceibacterium endophyticum]MXO64654.1 elongation factor P [Altericroceibacterium endophyticum]
MKTLPSLFLTCGLCIAAAAPVAASPISALERGRYVCETPGDAAGPAGRHEPDKDFRILGASRYVSDEGSGTYLRTGKKVIFTSGPRRGETYETQRSNRFLRQLDNEGRATRLRCIYHGR